MDEESQARGGRNSRTVEFQLQARIECDPKNGSLSSPAAPSISSPLTPATPLKDKRNSSFQITPSCVHLGNAGLGALCLYNWSAPRR
jgi:hypothetical protein